jgi:hypothetical protein
MGFLASLGVASATASPDKSYLVERAGILYSIFEDGGSSASNEYVENLGMCETTPSVRQVSTYLSVGGQQDLYFWYPIFVFSMQPP